MPIGGNVVFMALDYLAMFVCTINKAPTGSLSRFSQNVRVIIGTGEIWGSCITSVLFFSLFRKETSLLFSLFRGVKYVPS